MTDKLCRIGEEQKFSFVIEREDGQRFQRHRQDEDTHTTVKINELFSKKRRTDIETVRRKNVRCRCIQIK